jgi:MSHA pilin protein MshD
VRDRRGFTLVEVILVVVVAAIAVPSIMMLFTESVRSGSDALLLGTASRLAEDLMEEIRTRKWDENSPDGGGTAPVRSGVLGPEAGEMRASYDDIDDFSAITEQTPPRDAVNAVMQEFSGYSRSVAVEYVNDALVPSSGPTDHKRVTVTVSCGAGRVDLVTIISNH